MSLCCSFASYGWAVSSSIFCCAVRFRETPGCCRVSGMCCKRCTECLGFEPHDQSLVPERHPLRAAQCPCGDTSEDIDQDHAVLDCLASKYIVRRPGCLAISTMERRAKMLDECAGWTSRNRPCQHERRAELRHVCGCIEVKFSWGLGTRLCVWHTRRRESSSVSLIDIVPL